MLDPYEDVEPHPNDDYCPLIETRTAKEVVHPRATRCRGTNPRMEEAISTMRAKTYTLNPLVGHVHGCTQICSHGTCDLVRMRSSDGVARRSVLNDGVCGHTRLGSWTCLYGCAYLDICTCLDFLPHHIFTVVHSFSAQV